MCAVVVYAISLLAYLRIPEPEGIGGSRHPRGALERSDRPAGAGGVGEAMALQGNLRDFSVTEILQLLGSQKKTGCLKLEWNTERAQIHVLGRPHHRLAHARYAPDDPLLQFLLKVHRLSDEQRRGLLSIHKESGRDLEDLLINGRYVDVEELKLYIERQILNDLMRVVRWDNGAYRFEPKEVWPGPPLVKLSMEGGLIEAARRVDEQKRFVSKFKNPYDLLGVRDLPDPDEPLAEEEKELFGIIDGLHTVAEVVEAAPLSEYEAYEAPRPHARSQLDRDGRSARSRHRSDARAPSGRSATAPCFDPARDPGGLLRSGDRRGTSLRRRRARAPAPATAPGRGRVRGGPGGAAARRAGALSPRERRSIRRPSTPWSPTTGPQPGRPTFAGTASSTVPSGVARATGSSSKRSARTPSRLRPADGSAGSEEFPPFPP